MAPTPRFERAGEGPIGRTTVPGWFSGMLGSIAILSAWQGFIGYGHFGGGTIPTPLSILRQMMADGPWLYVNGALHTLRAASLGWLWGNGLAITLAIVALAVPVLERTILGFGVISFCLPIVAIGPVLVILFSGDIPKIVLAAMAVFFKTLVAAMIGLRGADATSLDLLHAFGGSARDQLIKVRLRAALPSLFAGLRVAAPSAVLGSIVGEFLGAENGLGVILINAQQSLNFSRTWATIIVATLVAGVAYAATSIASRVLTPWAAEASTNLAAGVAIGSKPSGRPLPMVARATASAGGSFLLVLGAWWALLHVFDVSPFIGKGPLDVLAYLTDATAGADNRAALAADSIVSIRDASIGLAAGTGAALLAAMAFTLWPPLQRVFIAPSLALQSMPLVALTPLIVLIFGRSLTAVSVIGGIIAFFPTLVNVSLAFARTPKPAVDLAHVYGGSRLATLLKIQFPMALPALFASLRIAAPLAMTGALLAEWLATGQGLGYAILQASAVSDYDGLWARVALVTAFSLALYKAIGAVEQFVLRRFDPMRP